MKRHISFALSLMLLLSVASCGSSESSDTKNADITELKNSGKTASETFSDGLPDKDMEGFTLNILHCAADSLNWATVQHK